MIRLGARTDCRGQGTDCRLYPDAAMVVGPSPFEHEYLRTLDLDRSKLRPTERVRLVSPEVIKRLKD